MRIVSFKLDIWLLTNIKKAYDSLVLKNIKIQRWPWSQVKGGHILLELDEFEQLNIEKAVKWTIHAKFKPEKLFTEKFVLDLHQKIYGDIWKWAGELRKSDKNIE